MADQLVAAAQAALPIDGGGLALTPDLESRALLAATDELAGRVEELQFILGEGPSTACAATGRPVLVEDLARASSFWPAFSVGAVEVGIAAVFAFPLQVGEVTIGVLGFHRDTPGALDSAAVIEALAWATVGTWVVLHLTPGLVDEDLFPDLTERLASRSSVHLTTGVLAARLLVSTDDALTILRARAFAEHQSTVELARDILAQTETAGDDSAFLLPGEDAVNPGPCTRRSGPDPCATRRAGRTQ